MQAADDFFVRFRDLLEKEIQRVIANKLVEGTGIDAFADYRYWQGRLQGMEVALEVARKLLDPMLSDAERSAALEEEENERRRPRAGPTRRYPQG